MAADTDGAGGDQTSEDGRRLLLRLARLSIRDRLTGGDDLREALGEAPLAEELDRPRAVFVTLKLPSPGGEREPGVLRGCIGTMTPIDPLHQAVIRTARSAAFDDPRFPPLDLAELQRVRISISVLTPMTPIRDVSEIVVGRDGVQLERGAHRSVFLPQVPVEQGWSRERYLEQLARKAGLDRDAWRNARLSTFRTESFEE